MLTIKEQEGESLKEYVKRFNKAILKIDEADNQVIMMTFQAGLNNTDLVFSLGKTPTTSMTNMLFKAQKDMNGEDALNAKGLKKPVTHTIRRMTRRINPQKPSLARVPQRLRRRR